MLPEECRPQRVGREGSAEQLNMMMEQVQNDRNSLMNQSMAGGHMHQQRMGWNPIQTEKIGRQGYGDQIAAQLAALQQQRDNISVPMRTF